MRVAETRAVNRALRKAYGIGLCSVEELGSLFTPSKPQHSLDPILVKAYAADFCGTPTLKEASRELVESFISHLAISAKENRDGLLCKLNSYAQPVKVKL